MSDNGLDEAAALIAGAEDVEEAAERADAAPRKPRERGFSVEKMNAEWALVLMGSKAVILHEQPNARAIEDKLRILSPEAFKLWFLNKRTEAQTEDGDIQSLTFALRWLNSAKRRQYLGIEFVPGGDAQQTLGYYNLWRGFSVEPKENGSWAIFRDHLLTNVCGGDSDHFKWLLAWFAHMVQHPRERIGTAIVLRGAMGSGKTKVGEVFGSLIRSHYFMVDDPRYVTGNFNAHMASCLLLQAEEAVWAGDKAAEFRLRGLITATYQMIEQKGVDPIRLENHVRLLMTSNEDWVVPAGKDERRFCVFDVQPHVAQNHEYFAEMDRELNEGGRERLLFDLLNMDLSPYNLRQIPRTKALLEQKIRSLDSVEAWWFERLMQGAPIRGMSDWPQEIAKARIFDDYITASDRIGIKRRALETELGIKIKRLAPGLADRKGYDPETSLRMWNYVLPNLSDARAAFEKAVGQEVNWPADDFSKTGNDGEREQEFRG